ncbi:hypothetical protein GUJ93_ZPchr0007g3441 [Zizania palustris]|uniref:Uncharacterized protein n=1 Tax=Zizania palustris TaxID=103762 RepID=A0A8J5TD15_ZIZPA|nr:hypothetical protein GUJ93_ZPchr0007g3441 [Zizania palustris]
MACKDSLSAKSSGDINYEDPDLISQLLDDLLHNIRWVAVWAGLPQLRFQYDNDDDDGCILERLSELIDSSLRRYAEYLNMRDLTISVHFHPNVYPESVTSWAALLQSPPGLTLSVINFR